MRASNSASRQVFRLATWRGRLVWFFTGVIRTLVGLGATALALGPMLVTHRSPWPYERALGRWIIKRATTQAIRVPPPPADYSQAVEAGRTLYLGMCSQCHGIDGDGRGWYGQLSYPPASALNDRDTQERTDAELFAIISRGLSFGGMPGFGERLTEEQLWGLIHYLRTLNPENAPASSLTTALPSPAQATAPATSRGAELYRSLGCANCHGDTRNVPGRLQIGVIDERAKRLI